MFLGRRRNAQLGGNTPSALDELLAAEREIAAETAAAEHEASALLAAACADADAINRAASEALARELAALVARDSGARDALVKQLEAEGRARASRYRALAEGDVRRLAAFVASDIMDLPPDSAA